MITNPVLGLENNFESQITNSILELHNNRIFMLMTLSSLKHQFTNLCKSPDLKSAVLKFTVKISIYKPM